MNTRADISSPPSPRRSAAGAIVRVLVWTALYLAVAAPMIAQNRPGRATSDETTFHLPTIERFARQWPRPEFADYPSATTPGYHLAVAAVRRYATADPHWLRLAASVFTIGLLVTLGWSVGRRSDGLTELALCLPLLLSPYVVGSGARLLPDNAGWWGVLGMLLLGYRRQLDVWTYVAGGLVLLALVLVRQIHLWAAAVLVMAAWLGPTGGAGASSTILPADAADMRRRLARSAAAVAAVVPSVAALAWFFHLWHGGVPPSARTLNAGANAAAPAMVLAVFGVIGAFYGGFMLPRRETRERLRRSGWWVAFGALVGLAASLLPPTDYNIAAGRYSGLWNVARELPVAAHRSLFIAALAALGGATVAAWSLALPRRDRWLFLTALLAFTAAHVATHEAYQRYYEPFALMMFALAAVRIDQQPAAGMPARPPRWALAGPLLLAAVLGVMALASWR